MSSRILIHNLGYPRMGAQRQLKKALESFWNGKIHESDLQETARTLRKAHWLKQKEAGVDLIPSNDFSFYDQTLDMAALFGAVPERFGFKGDKVDLKTYFSMARGKEVVPAMEMTKWFDTNYHYIVPEFHLAQSFRISTSKALDEFKEALALGIKTMPVLVGPMTFLKLGKVRDGENLNRFSLLGKLVPLYVELLNDLYKAGAEWVQLDEPIFSLDLTEEQRKSLLSAYLEITEAVPNLKVMAVNYFGSLGANLGTFLLLPVQALHVDFVRAAAEWEVIRENLDHSKSISLGIVDGRNIWKNDYDHSVKMIQKAKDALGADRLLVSPSCSLLHVPVSLNCEVKLNTELKGWLAFADEKLRELSELRRIVEGDEEPLAGNKVEMETREKSGLAHRLEVKARCEAVTEEDLLRSSPFEVRRKEQQKRLNLPPFPTTTIGSFPQTEEIRSRRALYRKGEIGPAEYEAFLEKKTTEVLFWQEEIGLDVLVHGEFERTDMVEYFGENLSGFAFTENGWVQSYGSRCVKPPIIYGDVSRKEPMTIRWSSFAQGRTKKPVKGMLTGPITILQWSFVRNDQPRSATARQIALALRDEVEDLEKAGISIIQVDEPALREGLPLRRTEWPYYLRWAVDAFRLATAVVRNETQIHTHMCYCEFNDIIHAIAELDADVISIESTRSNMELLEAFRWFKYPNDVGPGIYDIHSPRVPSVDEMETLARKALEHLRYAQLWINPDCGLKTRAWEEVRHSLVNMVEVARKLRVSVLEI